MKDINIVVVNYKMLQHIKTCFATLFDDINESGLKVQVTVVDNSENADGIKEYLQESFPQVQYIDAGGNIGFGKAQNKGLKATEATYYFALNPDTTFHAGADTLKKLFNYMEQHPKVGLVVVGDGSNSESLQRIAYKLQLQNNIIFESWSDDLVSYYKTADLFLNTSNFEGYGMTLIEAAASGCPVLTTDVGLVGDVLKEGSVEICKVGNKKCFIKKLEEILNNKAKLKTMTLKAMEDIDSRII
ncbi:MAG: hypothetical protein COT91_00240, partial [Candidatus Doudnabacteria bacterium CG10_big_fil_rev_8_21_14_0_10_41_10]